MTTTTVIATLEVSEPGCAALASVSWAREASPVEVQNAIEADVENPRRDNGDRSQRYEWITVLSSAPAAVQKRARTWERIDFLTSKPKTRRRATTHHARSTTTATHAHR